MGHPLLGQWVQEAGQLPARLTGIAFPADGKQVCLQQKTSLKFLSHLQITDES